MSTKANMGAACVLLTLTATPVGCFSPSAQANIDEAASSEDAGSTTHSGGQGADAGSDDPSAPGDDTGTGGQNSGPGTPEPGDRNPGCAPGIWGTSRWGNACWQ